MVVRTRLYTRGSQAFSRTLTKPPIQVTYQGRNNYALKGSTKYKRRIKYSLYVKCGSNTYILSYYSILLP
jgi:hypothetical protein